MLDAGSAAAAAREMLARFLGPRSGAEARGAAGGFVTVVLPALRFALQASDFDGALSQVKGFAAQLREDVETPSRAPLGFLRRLVRLALRQSQLPRLLLEFQRCGALTKSVLECVYAECAQEGETEMLWKAQAFAQTRGVEITYQGLSVLIRSATSPEAVLGLYDAHCRRPDISRRIGEGAEVPWLISKAAVLAGRPEVVARLRASADEASTVAVLKCALKEHRTAEALQIFRATPKKTASMYGLLVTACGAAGELLAAGRLLSEAAAAGLADEAAHGAMLKAYLQAGDLGGARETLDRMLECGHTPNPVAIHRLIDAAVKSDADAAWALVDRMQECGLRPTEITCSILLKSIQHDSRAIDVDRTLALISSLEGGMDEVLLGSASEACIRAGRADALRGMLRHQRSGDRVSVKGAHTYGSLIRACGFVGDVAGALEMWGEMGARGIVPTTVTIGCMVEALVSNGDPEAGYKLIRELRSHEATRALVNVVAYCSVLKGFSRQRRFHCVWALYQEMLAARMTFTIATYDALIDACARSCEMRRVPPILADMSQQHIEPNSVTYGTIIKGYCNEGLIDKALELLEYMKRTDSTKPDEITYNTLIDGCARMGRYERGMALLGEMEEGAVVPSSFTLSVAAKLGSYHKGVEGAFELCERLSGKYGLSLNVHVYNSLMQSCTTHGLLQRAIRLFERMVREHVRPNTRTYTILLRSCLRAQEPRDAAGLARAALGLPAPHFRMAGLDPDVYRLRGGLDPALVREVVGGIRWRCKGEELAAKLCADLDLAAGRHGQPARRADV